MKFVLGLKFIPLCPKCATSHPSSAHIFTCIGCHKDHLFSGSDEVSVEIRKRKLGFWSDATLKPSENKVAVVPANGPWPEVLDQIHTRFAY